MNDPVASTAMRRAGGVTLTTQRSERETRHLQALEAKLSQNPDDEAAFQSLLDAYRASGRWRDAAELLCRRLERNPNDWNTLRGCVTLFLRAGEPVRAGEILNRHGAHYEHQWELWHLRGLCLEELGRHGDALEEHRRAARLAPEEPQPRFRLGLTSLRTGEEEAALAHFQDALERDPRLGGALVNLGLLYERMGERERALEMLRRAAELEPDSVEAHLNLGAVYAEMDRKEEAAGELRRAIELDPRCADAHFNLALLLDDVDPEEALQRLRRAVTLEPARRDANLELGRICYRRGLYTAALKALQVCLEADPADTEALFFMALTYNKLDRPDETLKLLDELLKHEPQSAQAHFYRGVAYDKKGLYDKARVAYQKADELGQGREDPGIES
ncbi:MAG: tetratricopeptide repeat protein [Candidatus Eisenbacteria bacterium]|nr:tetratricopeptide repeat protein [Candidatus Eisenbacteria bacterium]